MKKRFFALAVAVAALIVLGGCVTNNHMGAFGDLYTAASITDDQLKDLSRQMRAQGDQENKVATGNNKYARRLARLTDRFQKEDGLDLNFKAYITKDVNANATADGSIRIYSGLMDMMTDNELLFVIGHEIGHVKAGHSLAKIRMAYASSGITKAAAASAKGALVLGAEEARGLLNAVLNAQFSQKQEFDADKYGYALMKKYALDTKAAVSALEKLNKLGASGGVMASHPNSSDRAKAIQGMIDKDGK